MALRGRIAKKIKSRKKVGLDQQRCGKFSTGTDCWIGGSVSNDSFLAANHECWLRDRNLALAANSLRRRKGIAIPKFPP